MAVSAQESDESRLEDVDRTDFTEEHLKEDKVKVASAPHADVEPAWIFPEAPESKLPIGGTTDLLVALANAGAKMFNISHIEGRLLDAEGALKLALPRYEYGQPLGPLEQRSFRFPINLSDEMALGEYTLDAKIYYNTRDKEPYVSPALSEAVELVPALPSGDAQLRILQAALGVVAVLVVVLLAVRAMLPAADGKAKGGGAKKPKLNDAELDAVVSNEWLAGTLAGTERRSPKKTKKG